MPSDIEFKEFHETHINQYFNSRSVDPPVNIVCPYIPILDNPFVPDEVVSCINSMKANKSCGIDGLPPGIFKLLTPQWILIITSLFNSIFSSGIYPLSWTKAKLFMLFKRGDRKDPNNYRGIYIF